MNPGISRLDGFIIAIYLLAVVGLGVAAGFLRRQGESGRGNGLQQRLHRRQAAEYAASAEDDRTKSVPANLSIVECRDVTPKSVIRKARIKNPFTTPLP